MNNNSRGLLFPLLIYLGSCITTRYVRNHFIFLSCLNVQVRQKSGEYIDVPYRGDAVLVNLGAMAENWTKDIYPATVRRACILMYIIEWRYNYS